MARFELARHTLLTLGGNGAPYTRPSLNAPVVNSVSLQLKRARWNSSSSSSSSSSNHYWFVSSLGGAASSVGCPLRPTVLSWHRDIPTVRTPSHLDEPRRRQCRHQYQYHYRRRHYHPSVSVSSFVSSGAAPPFPTGSNATLLASSALREALQLGNENDEPTNTSMVVDSEWDVQVLESSAWTAATETVPPSTTTITTTLPVGIDGTTSHLYQRDHGDWDDGMTTTSSSPTDVSSSLHHTSHANQDSHSSSRTTGTVPHTSSSRSTTLMTTGTTTTTAFPWIEERQWRLQTTTRLLTAPIGTWTMEDWLVVEDLLVQGWSRLDCVRSVVIQFPLLERCLLEHQQLRPKPNASTGTTGTTGATGATGATPNNTLSDSGVGSTDDLIRWDSKESLRNQIERWLHLHLLNDMVESWRLVHSVHATTLTSCHLAPADLLSYVRHTLHEKLGLALDAKTFYYIAEAAMSQPSRHGTPEFVESVLHHTIHLYRSGIESCFPRSPLWNLSLTAWVKANRGRDSSTAVWKIWSLMDEIGAARSKRTYLTALLACVQERSEAAARHAESLLQRMYSEYRDKRAATNAAPHLRNTLQPDVYCFTAVVDAWAKSQSPLAGPRAEQIYQQMMVLRQHDELFGYRKADTTLINCAIMCWGHAPTSDAIANAEAFWRQSQVAPDSVTYTTLIKLYAERGDITAAERLWSELQSNTAVDVDGQPIALEVSLFTTILSMYAKSKLENRLELASQVMAKMNESPHVQPNTKAFNAFLLVLSSIPKASAKQKAQAFIEEMKDMYHKTGAPTRPDFVTYSTVINAWAQQGHPERASEVLRLMYDDYLAGNETAKPDVQSFNTILASFIKCKDRDAPARAEQFLQHMIKIRNDGVLDLHLDVYSWSSFLACLSNSQDNRATAGAKAEEVLHNMRESYTKGDERVRPNYYCYNSVMDCWARASAAERAEAVFLTMCEDYRNGNESAKPQTATFNILLKAWAFSKNPRAAERGEEILRQMNDLTQSGTMNVPPNVITYTTLLTCYGLSKQPGAPQRAQQVVQRMDELFQAGAIKEGPNETTFRTLRKAWMYSREANREEALTTIDREMKKRFGKEVKSRSRA